MKNLLAFLEVLLKAPSMYNMETRAQPWASSWVSTIGTALQEAVPSYKQVDSYGSDAPLAKYLVVIGLRCMSFSTIFKLKEVRPGNDWFSARSRVRSKGSHSPPDPPKERHFPKQTRASHHVDPNHLRLAL